MSAEIPERAPSVRVEVGGIRIDPATITRRALYEAMGDATCSYWRRRAQTFLDARPYPGEYLGQATPAELSLRWRDLTGLANACLARAKLGVAEDIPELLVVMGEVV